MPPQFDDGRFDFEESPVITRLINNEVDRRTAIIDADARVAIANERSKIALLVMLIALFLAGASGAALLMSNGSNQPPVINIKQPN
jgi:hypothetical protein